MHVCRPYKWYKEILPIKTRCLGEISKTVRELWVETSLALKDQGFKWTVEYRLEIQMSWRNNLRLMRVKIMMTVSFSIQLMTRIQACIWTMMNITKEPSMINKNLNEQETMKLSTLVRLTKSGKLKKELKIVFLVLWTVHVLASLIKCTRNILNQQEIKNCRKWCHLQHSFKLKFLILELNSLILMKSFRLK